MSEAASPPTFTRVAVVNRGEPAMRFIVAARELEGEERVQTIALYTDPDRRALFVREADESYALGAATYVDAEGRRKSSYLDYDLIRRALIATRAEAVWVGWGFVAEHADFADMCAELGVVFIGPDGDMMRRLGDKIASKRLAEEAHVPVAPWSQGAVQTVEEAREHAERLGYPLMIKATAGGGGRGIRRVPTPSELAAAFESARSEAIKAFGDGTLFLERLVGGARHVEVQIIADGHGTTWALGVRDCTIQRRNQKILEETPSPALSEEQQRELEQAAVRLTRAIGYRNAGTVEFLYDDRERRFSFMEVNARLQVEHPVTELITGVDLVKLQIHVARGGRLPADPPIARGHAIEVRLNAEDPEDGFAPAPGLIRRLRFTSGPGIRVDTGVEEGDRVPAEFDSMVAKVMAWGRDRGEAIARLRRALLGSTVVLDGGASNKGFLLGLLHRDELDAAAYDVGWMDRLVAAGEHVSRRHAEVGLLVAAVASYDAELAVERAQFFGAAARGRPHLSGEVGRSLELSFLGNRYSLEVRKLGADRYRVEVDGQRVELTVDRLREEELRVVFAGRTHRVVSYDQGLSHLVEVDGVPHRISRDRGGVVRAPAPSVVVDVLVSPGDRVAPGDRLAILEAMKMEMAVEAKFAGVVREVNVIANVQLPTGAPLMTIEPASDGGSSSRAPRLRFDDLVSPPATAPSRDDHDLTELRSLVLGYDADASEIRRPVERDERDFRGSAPDDPRRLALEDDILTTFVDACALMRRRIGPDDELGQHSAEELLFTYLRDVGSRAESLSEAFRGKLRRALAHYEVELGGRTPELEEALFRLYKSRERFDEQVGPVLGLLQRRLDDLDRLRGVLGGEFRALLDRLVAETENRFPPVTDLARELLYHTFDKPLADEVRERAYDEMTRALAIAAHERGDRAADARRTLYDCTRPLASFLSARFDAADPATRHAILDVLLHRAYRLHTLTGFTVDRDEDLEIGAAVMEDEGETRWLLEAHVSDEGLADALAAIGRRARAIHDGTPVLADIYVRSSDVDSSTERLVSLASEGELPASVQTLVFGLAATDAGPGEDRIQYLTFRLDPESRRFEEERTLRGLHPTMAKRLDLWRLQNFHLERLPSADDLYLFRAVAHDNPKDERLFAIAEVRDLAPVRSAGGRVVGLPSLERAVAEAVDGIRGVQSQRAMSDRLQWNRVMLFVWPVIELQPSDINTIAHKLAPQTGGIGIERVLVKARMIHPGTSVIEPKLIDLSNPGGRSLSVVYRDPPRHPMAPLDRYTQNVVRLRRRGLVYPYELLKLLAPAREAQSAFPPGEVVELDLDADGRLAPVDRPPGGNGAGVVVGLIKTFTEKVPEGIERVIVLGDASKGMGAMAEPECRRIIAALDLAVERRVPLEWFAVSAGAKISMDSGVENMDWIAAVLRRLVEHTQAGLEVNVVVCGVNVGAQPYWNAEATMLMHTRGVLIMTPAGAMVLTGKRALDYSGGVSAEDDEGIGGFERVMGPNGQAQYGARDIAHACRILLAHYEHTYVVPGERFPRRANTTDPVDRDVRPYPHGRDGGCSFATVGEVFDPRDNPGRKKPFDVRRIMHAVVDQDHAPLERWQAMADAETAVVWDAHVGGYSVCLLGLESRPVTRLGFIPADGPTQWTAGTLFPMSSRKVARAINAASGNRPVVVLANLSGFDGSPESMRRLQLEYGAEIGRAVVNFRGPMVFCVISRYHGGAFVVFSNRLNDRLEVAALEGTYASVIGGAPAAAVVFAREVDRRTSTDSRVLSLRAEASAASGARRIALRDELERLERVVRTEKMGEVADEFDAVHSVHRAREVGAVERIIAPARLRPYLVEAVERGIAAEPSG